MCSGYNHSGSILFGVLEGCCFGRVRKMVRRGDVAYSFQNFPPPIFFVACDILNNSRMQPLIYDEYCRK
jgi:hypothetical protein